MAEVIDFENMTDEQYEQYRSEMMNENPEVITTGTSVEQDNSVSSHTSGSEYVNQPEPIEQKEEVDPNKDVVVDDIPEEVEVKSEVESQTEVEQPVESTEPEEVKEVKEELPSKIKIKALDGSDLEVSQEQVQFLINEHNKISKEAEALRPYSKTIDAIASNGLSDEDIALLIEAKGGNKDALGTLIRKTNIDLLDLSDEDTSKEYKPQSYGKDYTEKRFHNEIAQAYDRAGESKGRLQEVLTREIDNDFVEFLSKTPGAVLKLKDMVVDGRFDIIKNRADTLKMLSPNKSRFELFNEAEASLIQEAKQLEINNTQQSQYQNTTPQMQSQQSPYQQPQIDQELAAIRAKNAELRAKLGMSDTPNTPPVNTTISQEEYNRRQQEEALRARRIQAGVSAPTADVNNQMIDYANLSDAEYKRLYDQMMNH